MSENTIIPVGGRVHVKLVKSQEQGRKSEGGILLPEIAENTEDCVCEVIAASQAPGYELPAWVADRICRTVGEQICSHFTRMEYTADHGPLITSFQIRGHEKLDLLELCAQPREPRVEVGKQYLFDITLATQVPGQDSEFFIDESFIYAEVEGKIELLKTQSDAFGYRTI